LNKTGKDLMLGKQSEKKGWGNVEGESGPGRKVYYTQQRAAKRAVISQFSWGIEGVGMAARVE